MDLDNNMVRFFLGTTNWTGEPDVPARQCWILCTNNATSPEDILCSKQHANHEKQSKMADHSQTCWTARKWIPDHAWSADDETAETHQPDNRPLRSECPSHHRSVGNPQHPAAHACQPAGGRSSPGRPAQRPRSCQSPGRL